ncbi:hypothetical protein E4T56_gene18482 [Termitomyces sp. T112]|nr:hypothetical protein E4T56_gene18482 [Termitomyces sp. T112]
MDNFPPQCGNGNHYYYYYNAGLPPQTQNSQDDTRNALAQEGKLDIQKPEPFTGRDPWKWQIFLTQCLTMFQAKPITFQLESSQVAFATSYLQSIAFNYYTMLLWFDPNNPILSNWLVFTQEFLKAYKTGWNYNALRFTLHRALPQWIKDILCLAPKQTTYNGKNTAPRTSWNTSGNTNWQARATNGIQSSIPTNPANPTPCFPPGQGVSNTNRPLGQRPPAQLNAANLQNTPVPLDTNPDDHDDILDPTNDQKALCANRIQDSPWINVPEEMQEKRQKEGACILCVHGKRVSGLGLEDALDRGPYPDVFSTPAPLLRAIVLALDNPPAHLPSHLSTNLLLHTTLPFTDKPVPTLVDSGATDNFVDKSLAPPTDPDVTPDPTVTPTVPNPINSRDLNIKIIGAVPFACLLQEGTPAFQLQVMPALPKEYLCTGTTAPESKTEEQILSKVVPPEYHEFADMFSEGSAKELPPHCSYNYKINLKEGTSPPFGKIYNMSKIELQALKEYLDDMLSKGFICLSISAAGTPVLFAKKKDGSLRLCVDYRGLNKVTKKNWYPLPLIGDLVDCLHSAKIYTKIDLRSSYNNVQIAQGHEWKTAFRTHYGLFEYLVMPFRMTNSPATFQYFMNNIFHNMNDIFVIIYLDDILIYSNLLAEHLEHCSFHTMEVEYLGVIITPDSVHMDPAKVDAILNWPSLRNVKEDTPWDWDSKCQSIFLLLKKAFTSTPVLHHFNPSLPIMLECDASDYAIARILSQLDLGGKDLHPVAFYTQSIIPVELNYDIYDKKLLTIVKAFRQWRAYLEGSCHDLSPETPHIAQQPPTPKKTPDALPNFCPCPAPILANSDASPANSDSPLANFDAFPTATDTYPGSPEP